jgi:hypothetical protein
MAEHVLSGRNMSAPQNAWQAEERVPASGHKTRGRFRRDTFMARPLGRGARYASDAAFGDTHGASAHLPDDHSRLTFPVADSVERWHRADGYRSFDTHRIQISPFRAVAQTVAHIRGNVNPILYRMVYRGMAGSLLLRTGGVP